MAKIDTLRFGKEIKALTLINKYDYHFPLIFGSYVPASDDQKIRGWVKEGMEKYGHLLRSKIQYITQPLYKAWQNNEAKIIHLAGARTERGLQYGVHIIKLQGMIQVSYFVFDFKSNITFYMVFIEDMLSALMYQTGPDSVYSWAPDGKEGGNDNIRILESMDLDLELDWLIDHMEHEEKELKPHSKLHTADCVYDNHTNKDIKIITSTWFTTLVKSDEFKVRGHFRLQACGEGMKDRKLKWINEYTKEGYTRKADMLPK